MSKSRRVREKARSFGKKRIDELNDVLLNNGRAIEDGPKRKSWSLHDLRTIKAITPPQEDMIHSYINNYDVCAYGSAGTGKTLIALYLAFLDILDENKPYNKLIIVRSIVSTRDPGHLPGTLEEKAAPHEATYPPLFRKLFGKASTYKDMKSSGLVEFHTTSFVRGLTWDDAVVIFDESANTNLEEFDSVMTRMGKNTRVLVLGDIKQNDLANSTREKSGFAESLRVMEAIDNFSMVRFVSQDVVRSGFVKAWIQAREALGI